MAQWLRQTSLGHKITVYDLEVIGLIPSQVELGVHSTSV